MHPVPRRKRKSQETEFFYIVVILKVRTPLIISLVDTFKQISGNISTRKDSSMIKVETLIKIKRFCRTVTLPLHYNGSKTYRYLVFYID